MYELEIKRLYAEAGTAHSDAQALIDAHKGKEMPAETATQVDTLLDLVQSKSDAARRLERQDANERAFSQADESRRLPVNGGTGDEAVSKGDERQGLQMKAFRNFITNGSQALTGPESKALAASDNPNGGFLIAPQQFVAELIRDVDNEVFVRGIARVLPPLRGAHSLGMPSLNTRAANADWTAEITQTTPDTTIAFGKRELKPSPLSKEFVVSRTLMMQATLDPDQILRQEAAYVFGITEENAFLNGTGSNQPLGVFVASTQGISTGRDVTAAGASAIVGDDLINVKYSLKPQYVQDAQTRWILHRDVVKAIAKLKDSYGQYLWQPGLAQGVPDRLLGLAVAQSEYAPSTITTGLYTALLGNFRWYYIVDSLELQIQVLQELYARTNQIGYIMRAAVDGMPVKEEAFARLKQA